jgi:DNA-binding PadR family transcriptional regulator
LERAGLVEAMASDDRRRPYRLTPTGNAALAEHLAEMDRFVKVGRARLRAPDRGRA